MKNKKIDLNVDIAEGFPYDLEIIKYVSSINVACNAHAGNLEAIEKVIIAAKKLNVRIGAHPSYPDRKNFGRLIMTDISDKELVESLILQIKLIIDICKKYNTKLSYIKPHGALYNFANKNKKISQLIIDVVKGFSKDLKIMSLANGLLTKMASEQNLEVILESFADRRYYDDGDLVSRNDFRAVIHNNKELLENILNIVINNKVKSINNKVIDIFPQSICLHGDNKDALEFAKIIKKELLLRNISIEI